MRVHMMIGIAHRKNAPDYSRIIYKYEGPYLRRVVRLESNGSISYTHTYDQYNSRTSLSETGLFQTTYILTIKPEQGEHLK